MALHSAPTNSVKPDSANRQVNVSKEARVQGGGLFTPLLFITGSMLLMMGFQFYEALSERRVLAAQFDQQNVSVKEAKLVRRQLNAIASDTYILAQKGNRTADRIVGQLQKAGFTFGQQ